MLDFDLAEMYDVETKQLKRQVKRNIERFPADFMFILSKAEKDELVTNCDRFIRRNNLREPHNFRISAWKSARTRDGRRI